MWEEASGCHSLPSVVVGKHDKKPRMEVQPCCRSSYVVTVRVRFYRAPSQGLCRRPSRSLAHSVCRHEAIRGHPWRTHLRSSPLTIAVAIPCCTGWGSHFLSLPGV